MFYQSRNVSRKQNSENRTKEKAAETIQYTNKTFSFLMQKQCFPKFDWQNYKNTVACSRLTGRSRKSEKKLKENRYVT